ncbi:MAG: hypothetical protein NVS1B11_32790 [Terriglobales bacterium]
MGLVEVTGLATGPATMIAPVTQVPCYYSRTVGWQLRQSGKNKKWEKVADEVQLTPFYLDDNTGRVLVNPENAEMDIHQDFYEQYRASLFSGCANVPSNVALFLGRHGVMLDKNVKVEEYCIKPKNALFILGTLSANEGVVARTNTSSGSVPQTQQHKLTLQIPGLSSVAPVPVTSGTASQPAKGYGTETKVIRLTDPNKSANSSNMTQQEKVAAALMKAGITNPAAWAVAGVNTSEGTCSSQNSANRGTAIAEDSSGEFDLRPPVVLQRGKHESTFFISWRSQRDVVKSLNRKSGLMIWGGPALTLLCTYVIAAEFGWL